MVSKLQKEDTLPHHTPFSLFLGGNQISCPHCEMSPPSENVNEGGVLGLCTLTSHDKTNWTTHPVLCSKERGFPVTLGPKESKTKLGHRRKEKSSPQGDRDLCSPKAFPGMGKSVLHSQAEGCLSSNLVLQQLVSKWPLGLQPSLSSLGLPQSPSEQEHALCHVGERNHLQESPMRPSA